MKTITLTGPLLILLSLTVSISFAQVDSMFFHDGTFETQYGTSGAVPGNDYLQCVVRFTPITYPAHLIGIRAYFRNSFAPAPFRVVVYNDSAATVAGPPPNSQIYLSPSALTNPGDGGMTDSTYGIYIDLSSSNIITGSGDIYAGVTQYSQINGFIGAAIDNVNTLPLENDRQWISTSQGAPGTWYEMMNWAFITGHWGITAFFEGQQVTGINSLNNDAISIYPNPCTDAVFISSADELSESNIEWFDVSGRKIFIPVEILQQKMIRADMSGLKSGIYFCRILSVRKNEFRKVVVKN